MTNFWKALESVDMSQPKVEYEYRLYYDKITGEPLFYSMDKPEGTYIVVDKDVYDESRNDFKIVDGIIKYPEPNTWHRLFVADNGTPCHPENIMIISPHSEKMWALKTHKDV